MRRGLEQQDANSVQRDHDRDRSLQIEWLVRQPSRLTRSVQRSALLLRLPLYFLSPFKGRSADRSSSQKRQLLFKGPPPREVPKALKEVFLTAQAGGRPVVIILLITLSKDE